MRLTMAAPRELTALLQSMAPGTALHQAIQRITQQRNGALIVLGWGPHVEAVCSGGFVLDDTSFTAARLAELAKMDGAIVLDLEAGRLVRANTHLQPDPHLPSTETGARHRTAERVALHTGCPVLAVSETRSVATIFLPGLKHELESSAELLTRVNQLLVTLERFRRRFDSAVERLDRYEVTGIATARHVVAVLQRMELMHRIGTRIELDTVGLGGQAEFVDLQYGDLLAGSGGVASLVMDDHLAEGTDPAAIFGKLATLSASELADPREVAVVLGYSHLEAEVSPRGNRLLASVPRLPESVRASLIGHFADFEELIHADPSELVEVEGIGESRALQLRRLFDRALEFAEAE
jgi:diadenylate cyclase